MAYSASILTRAEARLKQAQRAHQQDQARRRAEIDPGPAPHCGD